MAKKKATKAGRPPLPAEERRESFISVRLTTEQRELIDRAAEAIGQQPGVYSRDVILRDARRVLGLAE